MTTKEFEGLGMVFKEFTGMSLNETIDAEVNRMIAEREKVPAGERLMEAMGDDEVGLPE